MDFTLKTYRNLLLSIVENGYKIFTFEEYCEQAPKGKFVILRHDVDLKPEQSLKTARIENELNIRATYYFRIVPESNQPDIIKAIADLGHEIGYHYEDLNTAKGISGKAYQNYCQNLEYFRQFYAIKTISMHGSPREKTDNRDLWKEYDYHQFGIIGEPYFDFLNKKDILYFTDTGRMWNGDKYNVRDKAKEKSNDSVQNSLREIHSTFDLIKWIETSENSYPIMINTHPQRWTDNKIMWIKELLFQSLKNQIKIFYKKQRDTR